MTRKLLFCLAMLSPQIARADVDIVARGLALGAAKSGAASIARFMPANLVDAYLAGTATVPMDTYVAAGLAASGTLDLAGGTVNLGTGAIQLPAGKTIQNGTIVPDATALGCIKIGNAADASPTDMLNPQVVDIRCIPSTLRTGSFGIKYANARNGGLVRGGYWKNLDYVIYNPNVNHTPTTYIGQNSNRIIIDGSHYDNVNYFIKGDPQTSDKYGFGDLTVVNNHGTALKSHLYIEGIDGLILKGNTMFFIGYNSRDQVKDYNVFIKTGAFLDIQGNHFFEAGKACLRLEYAENYNIIGNNVDWCGQKVQSSGIEIDKGGYTLSGGVKTYNHGGPGNVSNNLIIAPTGSCIAIDATTAGTEPGANTGNAKVAANTCSSPKATTFYYGNGTNPPGSGVPALNGTGYVATATSSTYRIDMLINTDTVTDARVNNNSTNGSTFGNGATNRDLVLTSGTGNFLTGGVTNAVVLGSTSVTITGSSFSGMVPNQDLYIYNFSSGTVTLTQDSHMFLKGGVTYNLPMNTAAHFRYGYYDSGNNAWFQQ